MSQRPYLRLLAAQGGNHEEGPLEAAFRQNARLVHAITLRILGNEDDVQDLLQDLYLSAKRDLRDLAHPAAVRRWFVTASVRLARRRLQRRRWFSAFGSEDPAFDEAIAPGASAEQKALLTAVYRVLRRLDANTRIAWTLRYVEGMSLEAVAEACACSLATAKRRITAAHRVVEEALRDE